MQQSQKPKISIKNKEQIVDYKVCVSDSKNICNLKQVKKDALSKQMIQQIIAKYKQYISCQKIIKFSDFLNSIVKDNEDLNIKFLQYGSYGVIFKFSYVINGKTNHFVAKFSMIYSKSDINNPEFSTNVEHIMYGVLQNIFCRSESQNTVTPYYSFIIDYEELRTEIFQFFNTDPRIQKAEQQFTKKNTPIAARCLIMEYVENSCDLVTYIKQNQLSEKHWKTLLFQVIFVLQIIQHNVPEFRHNDLKPNNILIQKQDFGGFKQYEVVTEDGQTLHYRLPRQGFLLKICDYDFASMKGLVENDKVLAEWTKKYHITNNPNKYYDMHYLFMQLQNPSFISNFQQIAPFSVQELINYVIPKKYKKDIVKKNNNRLTSNLQKEEEYITPEKVLQMDFFSEFR